MSFVLETLYYLRGTDVQRGPTPGRKRITACFLQPESGTGKPGSEAISPRPGDILSATSRSGKQV